MPRHVLLLDPPAAELGPLGDAFEEVCEHADAVRRVRTRRDLLGWIESEPPDLVVLDYHLGDGVVGGETSLREARARDRHVPIVVVTEEGGIEIAAEAIEAGATDLLVRSHRLQERVATQLGKVRQWVGLIDENRRLARENRALRERSDGMIGGSVALRAIAERVARVAKVPRPVLVIGERGTGKELVARALHEASGRTGAFVAVNCAAISAGLLEAELFGHERGAFTGAERRSEGKFEAATEGTLFLDEIGHMPLPFQTKILRAVEYGTFLRVGGTREVRVQTRIVAATNADLRQMIEEGTFLADLYDRLAFEEIVVPPLRERREDVEPLAAHFLTRFVREVPAFGNKTLSARALAELERYDFPGNVRELKNIIERAVYRDTSHELTPEDLDLPLARPTTRRGGSFKQQVDAFERELLRRALEESDGNQAEAARRLGLTYDQLRHYRNKHRLGAAKGPRKL